MTEIVDVERRKAVISVLKDWLDGGDHLILKWEPFADEILAALRSANTVRPEVVDRVIRSKALQDASVIACGIMADAVEYRDLAKGLAEAADWPLSTSDDTPAAVDRASVIEECAAYLDGYAGGHYMAKSCATVLRQVLLPTSGSTPDAESHACTNGVAEAQPADHLAQGI